jgi:two-component system KDP operon response regulator KdpE
MPSPRRVLIVTTSPERRRPLAEYLDELGFKPRLVQTADADTETDLAIVDTVDDALWDVAAELSDGRLIVIVAGARGLERGFGLPADDCVVDEARVEEIAARCDAVLRRTGQPVAGSETTPAVYADRRLWINFDSRQVWVGGRPAQLTPREFRLMRELVMHRDATLTHDDLLERVWGRDAARGRTPEVLKQYVWRLRQKIEPDPNEPSVIVTDPGEGYRFVSHSG